MRLRGSRSICGFAPRRWPSGSLVGQIWRPATTAAGARTTLREAVRQVVLSLIESLRAHESFWLKADGIAELRTWGTDPIVAPDAATWDYQSLAEHARHDIVEIKPLLGEVLEPDVFARLVDDGSAPAHGSTTSSGCGACMRSPPRYARGASASSIWPTCLRRSICGAPRHSCRTPHLNRRPSCRQGSIRSVRCSYG